jgi:hypothetical protein
MMIIYHTYYNIENFTENTENKQLSTTEIDELVKNAKSLVDSSNLGSVNINTNTASPNSNPTNTVTPNSYNTNMVGGIPKYYNTTFVQNQRPDSITPLLEQNEKILNELAKNAEFFAKSSGLGKVWVNTNMIRDMQDSYYTNKLKKSIPNPVLDIINKNTGHKYNDFVNYDPSVNSLPMYPNFINHFSEKQIYNMMDDIKTSLSESLLNIGINTKHKKDEKIKDYYTIR